MTLSDFLKKIDADLKGSNLPIYRGEVNVSVRLSVRLMGDDVFVYQAECDSNDAGTMSFTIVV